MSVFTSTSRSTMAGIAFASRTRASVSCLLRSPASYLLPSPTAYSWPSSPLILSHRAIHSLTRPLQSASSLKALGQTSSKTRSRASSTSPSASSPTATTSTAATAFRNSTTKVQQAASLSTRKVATLTSSNASIIGIDSTAPLVATVSTTIGRYSRPIITSPLPQQFATSTRTRARTANTSTATMATTTSTDNPVRTTARKPKLLRSWPKKVSVPGDTLGGPTRPGSGINDSKGVIANASNREQLSSMSLQHATTLPTYVPFALAGWYRTATDQIRTQESETLPFLDFRTDNSREVIYTKCDVEADQWLNSNPSKMWALDAEWRPFTGYGKQGKMALIQLGDDRTVYLFHVIHMKKFPEALSRILQDAHIFKVGINIRNDATKMLKDWGVSCASLVELGALSVQVQDDLSSQRKIRSMETLTKELLQHAVEKVPLTRMGNWESKHLSGSQLAYAANDVFVTYEVAEKIKELQRTRAKQDYVLPLATVHSEGTTVVTVRGSLQERLDRPATAEDIIVPVPKQAATIPRATAGTSTGVKPSPAATGYTKVSKANVTKASGQATRRRTINAAAPAASSAATSGRPTKTTFKAKTKKIASVSNNATTMFPVSTKTLFQMESSTPSRTATDKDRSAFSHTPTPATTRNLYASVDPYFFYGNTAGGTSSNSRSNDGAENMIRTIRTGSRSTVTIIPRKAQKKSFSGLSLSSLRRFSSSASAAAGNKNTGPKDSSDRKQQQGENNKPGGIGDVFFPSRLLPEPLDGKDVLERNQAVWMEAGGRDLSEDDDVRIAAEEQDDWHLKQNQALFASLVSPNPDSDFDSGSGSESESGSGLDLDLKDLESVLDKDVISSLLRKKT